MLNFIMRLLHGFYLKQSGLERISPNDWVDYKQIIYDKKTKLLTIKLEPNIKIFSIADTDSMDGLIDIGHNVIATDNIDRGKLTPGDVVIYRIYTTLIVHRIVGIKEDANGRIYRCRGDNNVDTDPYLLRDIHIKWLVLGVVY